MEQKLLREGESRCVTGMAEKVREASARGDATRLSRLLDDGSKALPDENGRSPLLLAAAAGHVETCEILIGHGIDVNASDNTGVTPLQRAAAEGHLDVVELLLKHGSDVGRQDTVHGNSALHESSWRGYSRTVAALAKALGTQRAPLHARNLAGFAPLHLACQNGHNQSCRELLLAGCNPDLQNNYGDTPLHTSARYGHAGVTRILISALCRVSDQNKNGDTALHIAAAMGRRKLTRILLEAGCERTLRNKQSETAKDIARRKNLSEILEIINKSRSKSRGRSKSREEGMWNNEEEPAIHRLKDSTKSGGKGEKKREKTGSGTSGSRDGGKKEKKKHKPGGKQHKVHFEKAIMGREWSPYGCHYYPDPEAFPQPRLDSLPSDPLARGEQYYLDLAGNIRKGPVGVGYTCYCAPFFRHMEAKLERDKAELKAHIDQAHERLDLKVANLERRTRGQISELTRCVAAERSKCEERHSHLRRWILRGGQGRHSERPNRRSVERHETSRPTRARSLEQLLDDRPQDRSFEIPGETFGGGGGGGGGGVGGGGCGGGGGGGSLDDLDIPAIPRSSESMRDLACSGSSRPPLRVLDIEPRLNETFDGVIGRDKSSHFGAGAASASPTFSLRQRVLRQQISSSHEIVSGTHQDDENTPKNEDENPEAWSTTSNRRSVHEMIKRFQQVPGAHNGGWHPPRSVSSEHTTTSPEHSQCSQGLRVQPQGIASNDWHPERQGNESESSEAEDEPQQPQTKKQINKHHPRVVGDNEHYESIAKLPYRSRSAVYSPTPASHDAHNDSGYSTRIYGSSKGASPSLSGQLECDIILPASQGNFPSGEQLVALLEQPRMHDITVYERGTDNVVINIGTASLV
ncbi:ankyrin repeat domain-containing protein 6 isoform X2 [Venturia canescens]|uniref:ankyrin repeat domain-containing protein 6 isoform X2 n=1 Tax=Venturia canescens TaxID=32260 RepID=UPI001C9CA5BB|nr:ankyrin repeat domain-containing protein 6 isoform X2 [Venturia canescens]